MAWLEVVGWVRFALLADGEIHPVGAVGLCPLGDLVTFIYPTRLPSEARW
jgi:hypothetical protein